MSGSARDPSHRLGKPAGPAGAASCGVVAISGVPARVRAAVVAAAAPEGVDPGAALLAPGEAGPAAAGRPAPRARRAPAVGGACAPGWNGKLPLRQREGVVLGGVVTESGGALARLGSFQRTSPGQHPAQPASAMPLLGGDTQPTTARRPLPVAPRAAGVRKEAMDRAFLSRCLLGPVGSSEQPQEAHGALTTPTAGSARRSSGQASPARPPTCALQLGFPWAVPAPAGTGRPPASPG